MSVGLISCRECAPEISNHPRKLSVVDSSLVAVDSFLFLEITRVEHARNTKAHLIDDYVRANI